MKTRKLRLNRPSFFFGIFLLTIGFLLTGCAGEKDDPMDGPPGEALMSELTANVLRWSDDELDVEEFDVIYKEQIASFRTIYEIRYGLSEDFINLVEDQSATTEDFQNILEEWDVAGLEFLKTYITMEIEKRDQFSGDHYRKFVNKEQDIIVRYVGTDSEVYE